jgi:GTP-binding protein
MLKDMEHPDMKIMVCKAGIGGKGNKAFATSTNQAPRHTELGKKGQARNLRLELKLIADAGLIGLPNAGKSTLVSRSSKAKPKIAAYPFTTLEPVLGIVELTDFRRFVMADIPGLIKNAHNGAGLGYEFLKHIERTKILVHILDIAPLDGSDPIENYNTIRQEISEYSSKLADKPEIIALNKIDLESEQENIEKFAEKFQQPVFLISAVTGKGINKLNEQIWKVLENSD